MKKHLSLSLILLLGAQLSAQIDRTQQPKPGPTPLIQLESPEEFRLKNGLTVLLVENHKIPQVSISLSIDHPLLIEGNKAGTNSLLTSMMGKGSKSITKNEFEEEINKVVGDGVKDERLKGIYDGEKRIQIYELSEKERENIPIWFKGPFYIKGGLVTSKQTGNEYELSALEKSIFSGN